jgi:uncharacterized protein
MSGKIRAVSNLFPSALDKIVTAAGRLQESSVNVAVTGLSQAGKTVFITSLIHNIRNAALVRGGSQHRMPLLRAAAEGRILGAELAGSVAQRVPQFPYKTNIARMASNPPDWPTGTTDVSEIEIELKFAPTGLLSARRWVGNMVGSASTLRLKITDYPGEWLLDLPMLRQSYAQWSRATMALCRRGIRAELARDWLNFMTWQRHDAAADEGIAKKGHDLYRAFAVAARARHGLSYLQPGRFVCPGGFVNNEPPFLWFCPIDLPDDLEKPAQGTLAALMEARYEVYLKEAVEPFFRDHFRRFHRQVVLVDVLSAYLGGEDTFSDARLALEDIMQVYRFGAGGWLTSLFGARIDRVLFAATKADHVTQMQRDHLAHLLGNMAALSTLKARHGNAYTDAMPIASVLCTEDGTDSIGGHMVEVVLGRPVGKEKRIKFFPGQIPIQPPKSGNWKLGFHEMPIFEPPPLDSMPTDGIPHINLDAALEFLIGDKLA